MVCKCYSSVDKTLKKTLPEVLLYLKHAQHSILLYTLNKKGLSCSLFAIDHLFRIY